MTRNYLKLFPVLVTTHSVWLRVYTYYSTWIATSFSLIVVVSDRVILRYMGGALIVNHLWKWGMGHRCRIIVCGQRWNHEALHFCAMITNWSVWAWLEGRKVKQCIVRTGYLEIHAVTVYPTTVRDNVTASISTVHGLILWFGNKYSSAVFPVCASPILDEYQYQCKKLSKIDITTWIVTKLGRCSFLS